MRAQILSTIGSVAWSVIKHIADRYWRDPKNRSYAKRKIMKTLKKTSQKYGGANVQSLINAAQKWTPTLMK